MRLRVFDFQCPLFWTVIFFRRQMGEPWLEWKIFSVPKASRLPKWHLHFWLWEQEPDRRPMTDSPEPERCEVCGWPLADSVANGCVPGNCSMRPRPKKG
jgi:hypothetical protein